MSLEPRTRSTVNARKPLRTRKLSSPSSNVAARAAIKAQVPGLTGRQKRKLIDQVVRLDALLGEDDPRSRDLEGRLIKIDERRHIVLVKSIPRVRPSVAPSKAEAIRVLAFMKASPLSFVQIWEDKQVVFSAEFTPKYVRMHARWPGEWEAALDKLVASIALH
jgi:hypothetical protein